MSAVDTYIESLPETKAEIASLVRELLISTVTGIEERFSFKIPFYHYYGMFCYINATKEGIDVGFCRGKDLVLTFPQLQMTSRVMVASLLLRTKKDINQLELPAIIAAAAAWNEEAYHKKISMVRKKGKTSR